METIKKYKGWIVAFVAVSIFMLIPYAVSYFLNHGNPYHQYMVNKYIPPYIEEQGYTKEDMKIAGYTEPKYLINRDYLHGHYEVVFKKEPEIVYFYGVKKWSHEVNQFCERDWLRPDGVIDVVKKDTKYLEKDCINSLDNRD